MHRSKAAKGSCSGSTWLARIPAWNQTPAAIPRGAQTPGIRVALAGVLTAATPSLGQLEPTQQLAQDRLQLSDLIGLELLPAAPPIADRQGGHG